MEVLFFVLFTIIFLFFKRLYMALLLISPMLIFLYFTIENMFFFTEIKSFNISQDWIIIGAIYLSYYFSLHYSAKFFDNSHPNKLLVATNQFVMTSVMLIGIYVYIYIQYGLIVSNDEYKKPIVDTWDLIYYSVASFTTLGAGDMLPKDSSARVVQASESFLGVTHTVLFITYVLYNKDSSHKKEEEV